MEATQQPSLSVSRLHRLANVARADLGLGALAFIGIATLGAGNGGYYPVAWGWTTAALAWLIGLTLLLRSRIEISRLESVTIGAWILLLGWSAASVAWSIDPALSVLELERDLVYLAAVLTFALLCRKTSGLACLVGTWAAICVVCGYSVITHLFPDRFGVFNDVVQPGRLFQPIGYWNALGIFAGMGIMLALGLAARRGSLLIRCLSAASIPMLGCATYFTYSRGAWIAIALTLVVLVAIIPSRLAYLCALLATAPWLLLSLLVAHDSPALSTKVVAVSAASHQGAHLLPIVALSGAGAALTIGVLAVAQGRLHIPAEVSLMISRALLILAVVAGLGVVAGMGGPGGMVQKIHHALTAKAPHVASGGNLSTRLDSLALNGRPWVWKAALQDWSQHAVLGSGGGTYRVFWYEHRTHRFDALYSHSLYLQVLAELGPAGLLALVVALGVPVWAAIRSRRHPLVPIAFGAYLAFLVHAAVDWDWQFPALVLAAIACAATLLVLDRERTGEFALDRRWRIGLGVVAAATAVIGVVGLIGNRALSSAESDLASRNWAGAISQAQTAHTFAPWSPAPDVVAGEAEAGAGQNALALRYYRQALRIDRNSEDAWRGVYAVTSGTARAKALSQLERLDPLQPPPGATTTRTRKHRSGR